MNQFYKLMLVTSRGNQPLAQYLNFIRRCASSGITSVQLREKTKCRQELTSFGRHLNAVLKPFNIPLIVNDDVTLAIDIDAAGVHLGQNDGDVRTARKLLGPNKIIGLTIDFAVNMRIANTLPINYVGISSVFPSRSKKDTSTVWGTKGLTHLSRVSRHPMVGIGGINESNACDVMLAGADGIAAIEVFHDASDLELVTRNLRNIIDTQGEQYDQSNRISFV